MDTEFTLTQKRALAIATVIAILFGAYFLRGYFILIVVAAVVAYLFTPLYNRLNKRLGTGVSATLTLLAATASVIVPLGLFVLLAVVQITEMVKSVADWVERTDLSTIGDKTLRFVNEALARVPFVDVTVTPEMLRKAMTTVAQKVGQWLLHIPAGGRGRRHRRDNRGDPLPVRVHFAADQQGCGAEADPPAQSARRRGHRPLPGQDGRDGEGHGQGPVRHRAVPRCGGRGVDLHRRLPRRLLHFRNAV